jgi:hypothetical protein
MQTWPTCDARCKKNPYDPINFIKIQCKIPEGLNFENIADDIEFNFGAEIAKYRMEDTKSLTNMQTKHDELLVSLSKEGYEQINYAKS